MNPSLQPVQIAFYGVLGALGCLIIGYNYRFSLIGNAGTHVSPAPIIGGALAVYGTSKLIDSRWVLLFLVLEGRKHLASPIHPELGIPLPAGLEFIPEHFKNMVIVYGEKTSETSKTKETVLISLRGIRQQGD